MIRVEFLDLNDISYGTCNDVLQIFDKNTNAGTPMVREATVLSFFILFFHWNCHCHV